MFSFPLFPIFLLVLFLFVSFFFGLFVLFFQHFIIEKPTYRTSFSTELQLSAKYKGNKFVLMLNISPNSCNSQKLFFEKLVTVACDKNTLVVEVDEKRRCLLQVILYRLSIFIGTTFVISTKARWTKIRKTQSPFNKTTRRTNSVMTTSRVCRIRYCKILASFNALWFSLKNARIRVHFLTSPYAEISFLRVT